MLREVHSLLMATTAQCRSSSHLSMDECSHKHPDSRERQVPSIFIKLRKNCSRHERPSIQRTSRVNLLLGARLEIQALTSRAMAFALPFQLC